MFMMACWGEIGWCLPKWKKSDIKLGRVLADIRSQELFEPSSAVKIKMYTNNKKVMDYFFDFVPRGFTFSFSSTVLHSSIGQP